MSPASRGCAGQTQGCLVVLVDTSVWIRALANPKPWADELDRLLSLDQVTGHDLVYGELLLGDRGGRKELLASYERMHQAAPVPHRDVIAFVRGRHLYGRGVAWIDVHLLASAVAGRLQFWTADLPLVALAAELGVAYAPA